MKGPSETSPVNGNVDLGNQKPPEDDFSEYLWMENEEEFDKEVMKQLEEEALMEQCIQAMIDDEKEPSTPPSPPQEAFQEVTNSFESLHVKDKEEIVMQSKLNPNAAEFVPRTTSSNSVP